MTEMGSRWLLRPAAVTVVMVVVVLAVAAAAASAASEPSHVAGDGHDVVGPWAVEAAWDAGIGAEYWVGVVRFAADGTCDARITANVVGALPHTHESSSCTYGVGGDGMGSWTMDLGDGPISATFVVGARWTQMRMLFTAPTGVNATGEALRQ